MLQIKLFLFSLILGICHVSSELLHPETKCSLTDESCMLKLFNDCLHQIAEKGAPALDIPAIDPYEFSYWNESFPSNKVPLLQSSFPHGCFKGFDNCNFTKYQLDVSSGRGKLYLQCNEVIVDTDYVFQSARPLLGGSIAHGKGNFTADFENLLLKIDLKVNAYKKDDGKVYLKFNKDSYTYELGHLTLNATEILIGDKDITKPALAFANAHWRILMSLFGERFMDAAFNVYKKYGDEIHASVPASEYISTDLEPLLEDSE